MSPSLKNEVTSQIFITSIKKNKIFRDEGMELINFIVFRIETLLFFPEDFIIR